MRLIYILILFVSTLATAKANKIQDVTNKALEITRVLVPKFEKGSIDIQDIEKSKDGVPGTAIKSISCNKSKIDLPNGNQEIGYACTVGLGSGLNIILDKKLNPIKISYFAP